MLAQSTEVFAERRVGSPASLLTSYLFNLWSSSSSLFYPVEVTLSCVQALLLDLASEITFLTGIK